MFLSAKPETKSVPPMEDGLVTSLKSRGEYPSAVIVPSMVSPLMEKFMILSFNSTALILPLILLGVNTS